jgi:hypothetical protein
MGKINTLFPKLKTKVKNKMTQTHRSVKTSLKNGLETFQTNFEKAKKKPVSKRRAFLLGFTTVISLVGVTIFAPILPAMAKDLPKTSGKPDGLVPTPPSTSPTTSVIKEVGLKSLATFVGGICAAAVTNGTFALGALCGFLVASGILANKKEKPN